MASSRILDIMTDSFFDGITGAALFGKLRRPGAPTVLFDERSVEETSVVEFAIEDCRTSGRRSSINGGRQ